MTRRKCLSLAFVALICMGVFLQFDGWCAPGDEALAYSHGSGWREREALTIDVSELPHEARETLALIRRGGPFPYRQDGTVFGNRERRLPERPRGYYREYTVKTPGSRDRGARRIVVGSGGEAYYTDDHYNTFKLIRGALQ